MKVRIRKLNDNAIVPTRGSAGAAGYDLYACIGETNITPIEPGETVKIGTGIAIAIPHNSFGAVFARSGLATKRGLRPAICVGVIDEDYRGEVIVALQNDSDEVQYIHNGDRIAQLVIIPYVNFDLNVVEALDDTERGAGGFGSTGESDADAAQISFFDILGIEK